MSHFMKKIKVVVLLGICDILISHLLSDLEQLFPYLYDALNTFM